MCPNLKHRGGEQEDDDRECLRPQGLKSLPTTSHSVDFASLRSPQHHHAASGVQDLEEFILPSTPDPLPPSSFHYFLVHVVYMPFAPSFTLPFILDPLPPPTFVCFLSQSSIPTQAKMSWGTALTCFKAFTWPGDEVDLCPHADGRFGLADCFQWPQTYEKNYKYAVCIPQKNMVPTLNIAWFTLTSVDFVLPLSSVYPVGTLEETKVKAFEELLQQLHSLLPPPPQLTCGSRPYDPTSALQCKLLDIYALLEYIEILYPASFISPAQNLYTQTPPGWGASRRILPLVKHFWLMHTEVYISPDMNIKEPVRLTCPEDIVKAMYSEKGVAKPFPSIYRGAGSLLHQIHTHRDYEGTFAEQPEPLQESFATSLSNPSSSTGKQSMKKQTRAAREQATAGPSRASHPKQSGGGDSARWEEPDLPEIPKPHSLFALAWRKASKDISRVKSGIVDPGYHFPKPTLLVNVTTPELKEDVHVELALCSPGLDEFELTFGLCRRALPLRCGGTSSMVLTQSACPLAPRVHPRSWWFRRILGDIIQAAYDDPVHMSEEIEWRGMQQVRASSLSDPPLHFTCSLLWELYELNFYYELHALDQALVLQLWPDSLDKYMRQSLLWSIFPGGCGLSSWSAPLPQEPHDLGLTASAMEVALPYLNKFCQLLSAWPGAPFRLKSPIELDGSGNQAAYEAFILACEFYIQTAFDYLGHQPSLPCIFTFV
ncbi:hypothetical protein F5J12DRAFT_782163 [Pisolithus orientalis]|uniref:uncharacterized protein n=1 Tax=Pisolithus orientalis TaxID=936130 RepID=UPI0022242346|nr:uncharacterized protein F5J12DRAFT_782163 [Pisolithus orientalis]KAI6008700.1 hypothetical protein F5J12DRAFT_782163 [Pisolithus orientalis]